ncbi:hypothetical protein V6R21_23480 [Limibacter armeniacum]|uniref:hypothetical protein n=1 Tax=Limibacter armeniacum TaxID=466084 RepID=UPI002FE66D23
MEIYKTSFPNEEFPQRFPDAEAVVEGLNALSILYHDNQDKESSFEKSRISRSYSAEKDAEELSLIQRQLPSAQSALTQAETDGDPEIIALRQKELRTLTDRIDVLEEKLTKAGIRQQLLNELTAAGASALADSAEERGYAVLDWLEAGGTGIQGTFKFLKRTVTAN